jgi:hypothetical protein
MKNLKLILWVVGIGLVLLDVLFFIIVRTSNDLITKIVYAVFLVIGIITLWVYLGVFLVIWLIRFVLKKL